MTVIATATEIQAGEGITTKTEFVVPRQTAAGQTAAGTENIVRSFRPRLLNFLSLQRNDTLLNLYVGSDFQHPVTSDPQDRSVGSFSSSEHVTFSLVFVWVIRLFARLILRSIFGS